MEKQTFRLAGTPNGAIRPHEAKLDLLARVADAFWICAALFIACAFYPEAWEVRHSMAAAFAVVLFYMVGQAQGLYRAWRAEPVKSEFSRIWACWAFVIPLLLLVAFMTKTSEAFSRIIIFTWFVLAPALVSVWRVSLRMTLQEARARGYNTRTVAIAGASPLGEELARSIGRSPWMGMKMAGFYDDRHVSRLHPMDPTVGEVKGDLERLVGEAREGLVDVVYIALPMRAEPRINAIIRRLQDTTASVYLAYDFGGFDVLCAQWGQVGNVSVMSVDENPFHGIEGFAKRAEDLVLGSLIMLGISLPMLAIALAVKLSSRGPVFFRQRRYGLNGEEIRVLKFRSMTVTEDGPEVKQATKGDQRITKVGAFLRHSGNPSPNPILTIMPPTSSTPQLIHGGAPPAISITVHPKDHTSEAGVVPSPLATSGAIHSGVPDTEAASPPTLFAVPKSASLTTSGELPSRMFPPLTSLCTIPAVKWR